MNPVVTESPSVFQTKYDEFAKELLETFPEQAVAVAAAIALTPAERLVRFQADVKVNDDEGANPGALLPGVALPDAVWTTLSVANRKVLRDYVRLLSMCCFLEGFGPVGPEGPERAKGPEGTKGPKGPPAWMDKVMGDWKSKLSSMDFEGLLKKCSGLFGGGSSDKSTDPSGNSGFKLPKLPEKFLKGQLAKLAEEIVKDIKAEDLGLTPEMMAECEASPSRAFELLLQVMTKNPGILQDTIKKIGKPLQQKIQSGSIRPQEIAKEAEELMKEFSENTEFVGMMDSFKSAFGFEDMDIARKTGNEGSARLSLVKERLRKKLAAKEAAAKK
jgi:hypothetical protein